MSQCYITNIGAGLVQRSVAEKKPIVFSRVCFNTEYVGKASALFFKPVEWYGENLGVVVGSQSHVSVSGVSCLCNTQLAIQCNDNSKAWKTVSVFAHLEGEDNEILFAAQSLMNGTVKNVFMMEIPICLNGAVEDFGDVMDADVADAVDFSGLGASLAYDGEDTAIQLKNNEGEVISEIDASDFVIDGMVEDVEIVNDNLVISFNTASGKQDIEIPLSDIFDPSQYYTKAEIDGTFLNQVSYNSSTNSLDFSSEDGERNVSVSLD